MVDLILAKSLLSLLFKDSMGVIEIKKSSG